MNKKKFKKSNINQRDKHEYFKPIQSPIFRINSSIIIIIIIIINISLLAFFLNINKFEKKNLMTKSNFSFFEISIIYISFGFFSSEASARIFISKPKKYPKPYSCEI
jgi:hypothetical protein